MATTGERAVLLTVDTEPDCPPYLNTYRGIESGIPRLLELLRSEAVPATFFVTGDVARRFPDPVRAIVRDGHELGCHGSTHRDFTAMSAPDAREEIRSSLATLRTFATVRSFRAPYLRFPVSYLTLLEQEGIAIDSSQARYKPLACWRRNPTALFRLPVSVTSSVLRLPSWIRNPWLAVLSSPVVLFVHPWEFVDLREEKLRLDCRFKTGDAALDCLRDVIGYFKRGDSRFLRISDLGPSRSARLS